VSPAGHPGEHRRLPLSQPERLLITVIVSTAAVAAAVLVAFALGGPGDTAQAAHQAAASRVAGTPSRPDRARAPHPAQRHPSSRPTAAPWAATPAASGFPLAGKVVGIDPGHNGGNWTPAGSKAISRLIWNGRNWETCDTTGTETDGGYWEATFTWNVARYLTRDLQREGARVVLTRHSNTGIGPCVTTRAEIIDRERANVAIDIHGDGGPPSGRGFSILEPVPDRRNDQVIGASERFGLDVRSAFLRYTGMPISDYYGVNGLEPRDDLAGLNLTTVPKVLIECGNMRNATDAHLMVTRSFQRRAAQALAVAITTFLTAG
jgi:N-acetylmuramoyl-L-alanine amidase